MIRSLFVCALLAHGGLAMAQPGATPANPFGGQANPFGAQTGRVSPAAAARTTALRSSISQAEEAVLLRHFEKLLEMKLDMELQLEFAQTIKGPESPEIDQTKKRLAIVAKRIQDTKAQLEEKYKVRQDELLKQQQQQQLQMQQLQQQLQRRNEEGRNNFNGQLDERRLERISLKRVAADDVVRAVQAFAAQNQKKIQNLSIQTEARSNSVVLFGTENDLKAAKEVIENLDKAPKAEKEPEKPK